MNLDEVLNYRRSVRVYDKEKEIDTEKVKHCLELATLAPNSSDMQLWEFYHITQPELMAKVSRACLYQSCMVALFFHFAIRNAWHSPYHCKTAYLIRSFSRIYCRIVLWCHWNFVYLKKISINLIN